MPQAYQLQNYVGKHVTSLQYRAALKLKRTVYLKSALLSVLPQLLFQYVHRAGEIYRPDCFPSYPEEWFWTYFISERKLKSLWYTLAYQSFDVKYTFLSHVLWANLHDLSLSNRSVVLILLTLTATLYDHTRRHTISPHPDVYRVNKLLQSIYNATKDHKDWRCTIMSAGIVGCQDYITFKLLISYGGNVQKAKMLVREVFVNTEEFYPYGRFVASDNDYYYASFGSDFNQIPYKVIAPTAANLLSYQYEANATRDSTYKTFRRAITIKNWDLVELGLSMNVRVDNCYVLALINGNLNLAVRLYKLANDTDACYEAVHRQLVHSEDLIFRSAKTSSDVMRFFNFAEVVEPGKEDIGLKAPAQLSKWCTAGAMSTALFYGTSKRRALVLRELYTSSEGILLVSNTYADSDVYSVLHEAGTCAFICLISQYEGVGFNTIPEEQQQTCLHVTYSADVARALLAGGANPNVVDCNGNNSLGYAVADANLPLMDVLLHHGSPERTQDLVSLKVHEMQLITCLVTRLDLWSSKMPDDISECDCNALIACEMLLKCGVSLEATDEYLSTPLMYAVLCGNVVAVKFLLSKGASITARDKFDFGVFAYCGRSINYTDRTIEMVDLLLYYAMDNPSKYAVEKIELQEDIIYNLKTKWQPHGRRHNPWCARESTVHVPHDIINDRAGKVIDHIFNKYGQLING